MMPSVLAHILVPLNAADLWALHAFNSLSGNSIVDHTIEFISASNFVKGAVPLAIYWYFWSDDSRRLQDSRAVLLKGIAAALLAVVIARLIAHSLPVRIRPFADPSSGFVSLFSGTGRDFEDWSSFPSDTAAFEFALAWSLMPISRIAGWFLVFYGGIFACVTRIYLGIHYPSDVVVGIAIGIAVATLVQKLNFYRFVGTRLVRSNYVHPLFYALLFLITYEYAQVFDDVRAIRKVLISYVLDARQRDMEPTLVGLGLVLAGAAVVCLMILARIARTWPENRRYESSSRRAPQTAEPAAGSTPPIPTGTGS